MQMLHNGIQFSESHILFGSVSNVAEKNYIFSRNTFAPCVGDVPIVTKHLTRMTGQDPISDWSIELVKFNRKSNGISIFGLAHVAFLQPINFKQVDGVSVFVIGKSFVMTNQNAAISNCRGFNYSVGFHSGLVFANREILWPAGNFPFLLNHPVCFFFFNKLLFAVNIFPFANPHFEPKRIMANYVVLIGADDGFAVGDVFCKRSGSAARYIGRSKDLGVCASKCRTKVGVEIGRYRGIIAAKHLLIQFLKAAKLFSIMRMSHRRRYSSTSNDWLGR